MKTNRVLAIFITVLLAAALFGCGAAASAKAPEHLDAATYAAAQDAQTAAQAFVDGKSGAEDAVKALDAAYDTLAGLKITDQQKSGYNALIGLTVDALRYDIQNSTAADVQKDLDVLAGYLAGTAQASAPAA